LARYGLAIKLWIAADGKVSMLSEAQSRPNSDLHVTRADWWRNIVQISVSALVVLIIFSVYRLHTQYIDFSKAFTDAPGGMQDWRSISLLLILIGLGFVIYMVQYVFNKNYNAVTKILFSAAGFLLLYELSILARVAFL
jgi:hypothetical protein